MLMKTIFIHKSNAYQKKIEGNDGKNILALDMLQRVLKIRDICRLSTS